MGFMDKAKEAAERAAAMAQQGLDQGQQKLDEYQQQREAGELYQALGEAFYAEQRSGGPRQDVIDALARLDRWQAQSAPGRSAPPVGPGEPDAPRRAQPGGFTLDGL